MAHRTTPLDSSVHAGWPQAGARHFRVSRHTVAKWPSGRRELGAAPPRARIPGARRPSWSRAPCDARRAAPQWALGVARSTVYAVLRRRGLNSTAWRHPGAGPLRATPPATCCIST